MKTTKIKSMVKKISKHYGVESEFRVEKVKATKETVEYIEVRTELTLDEGGYELMEEVEKATGYSAEYQGGCVYYFYKE